MKVIKERKNVFNLILKLVFVFIICLLHIGNCFSFKNLNGTVNQNLDKSEVLSKIIYAQEDNSINDKYVDKVDSKFHYSENNSVVNVNLNGENFEEVEDQLNNFISDEIDSLDLSDLESLFYETEQKSSDLSFKEYLLGLIKGEYDLELSNIVSFIGECINKNFSKYLKIIIVIFALSILCTLSKFLSSNKNSTNEIVFYVFYFVIAVFVIGVVFSEMKNVLNIIGKIKNSIEIIFPILLALLSINGASASTKLYQPAVAILSGGVVEIFTVVLLPIVSIGLIVSLIGNFNENIKLDKMQKFVSSLIKWIIGIVFTVFVGFLSIQGLTASAVDKISIKTAKYAIKSYIPIVGGYFSDTFEIFRAGTVLIKNSIGVVGIVLLFYLVLSEVLGLIFLSLAIKFSSGLIEPLSDGRVSKFLSSVSSFITYMLVVLLTIFAMAFIVILLIVTTANVM